MSRVSLLIVNYNSWGLCAGAIRSFGETLPKEIGGETIEWEAIVVDNDSAVGDPEAEAEVEELCRASGGRLVRHDSNSGYSQGMNLAFEHATGDWILISNPDIRYLENTVAPLIEAMQQDPSIGTAAPRGYFCDDLSVWLPPNILPTPRDLVGSGLAEWFTSWNHRYSRKRTVDAVRVWCAKDDVELQMLSGCCFLMRRSDIDELGFFDPDFPLYYEDTDLSVRLRKAGLRIVQVAAASVVHYYDRSGQTDNVEKMRRYWISKHHYFRKHHGWLGGRLQKLVQKLQESGWGQRRKAVNPYPEFEDLGAGHGRPVLRFPNAKGPVVIEIALDPLFLLTGGALAEGDTWCPTMSLMSCLGPMTYWFRAVDLGQSDNPVVGVYRYQLHYPIVDMVAGPDADARAQKAQAMMAGES
ncbi:MAG: glycosyltransferase family 2 protein [Planctomycetota bacterium]